METIFTENVATGKQHVIRTGESLMCKRVYQDGIITITNMGKDNTKVTVLWMNNIEVCEGETQFALEMAPGSTVEFEMPANATAEQFLDTVVLDHISGAPLMVSCMMPPELLN